MDEIGGGKVIVKVNLISKESKKNFFFSELG